MLTRRQVLGVSIAAAAAAHALLIALSPQLPILQARSVPAKQYSFSVRVVDDVPPPPATPPDATRARAAAPGDMTDLLERETETLTPAESLLKETVDIPNVDERVASDPIDREYSLEPDPKVLSRLDARILEISQDVARDDIHVARREVAPSSNRLVGENEFPVLRSPLEESPADVLMMAPPFSPPSATGPLLGHVPAPLELLEKPPIEEGVVSPDPAEGLPEMPKEVEVARAPVREAIKQENTSEFMDDLVEIAIDTYVPPGDREGFFRLRMLPRKNQNLEVLPKDITYVIDASNSILQRKLDKTVEGVARSVQLLRPEDHFNIVIFRDSATSFRSDRVPATPDNMRGALDFLEGQQSKGQTDVYQAMVPVVESQTRSGVPGMIVVLSDGRPTTGVRDGRTIINALTDENNDGKTILAIGGGNTVNRYLLDLLAYRNKGESFVSADFGTLDQDLPRVLASVNDPLLTDLQAEYARVNENEVFPKEVPDFFRDKAVTIYGRYSPAADEDFVMRLAGAAGDRTKEVIFRADLDEAPKGDETIARNWAFQKIYYLIGEICRVGEKPELLAELRDLSRKYGIRTSYSE